MARVVYLVLGRVGFDVVSRLGWQWGMTGEASSRGCAAGGGLGPPVVFGGEVIGLGCIVSGTVYKGPGTGTSGFKVTISKIRS